MVKIDLCSINELPELLEFINLNWKKEHSLITSRELMNWQHFNKSLNCYNFLMAKDIDSNKILGILGFIPTWQFDESLFENGDIYGAIWKIDDNNPKAIGKGHSLFKELQRLPYYKNFGAIGISRDSIRYMRIINYKVEKLIQYYIINSTCTDFKIAEIQEFSETDTNGSPCNYCLRIIEQLNNLELETAYKPIKTIKYLFNKYQQHPIYNYSFYGIFDNDSIKALFVIRKIELFNSSCLRIIDCIGDLSGIGSLYPEFQKLLKHENAEYIDFYNYGINPSVFQSLGFDFIREDDKNIIPNYFEPFEKKNITLECAFNSTDPDYVFFKGDSDQDRPNLIR